MSSIKNILARQIFDSNGYPAIECDIFTAHAFYRACVGSDSQIERRTNDQEQSFHPDSFTQKIEKCLTIINETITPALIGQDITNQLNIDKILAALPLPPHAAMLGANISLAISMAVCRGGAAERNIPLYRYLAELCGNNNIIMPTPFINVINGGILFDNELPFKEFLVAPTKACSYSEAIEIGSKFWHSTQTTIQKKFGKEWANVTEKGGFAPPIKEEEDALDFLMTIVEDTQTEGKIQFSIIVGADSFYDKDTKLYNLDFKHTTPVIDEPEFTQSPLGADDLAADVPVSPLAESQPVQSGSEDSTAVPTPAIQMIDADATTSAPASMLPSDAPSTAPSQAATPAQSATPAEEEPKKKRYHLTNKELVAHYVELVRRYPIVSFVDALAEEDVEGSLLLVDAMKRAERKLPSREEEEEEERRVYEAEEEEARRKEEEEERKKKEEEERLAREEEERRKQEEEEAAKNKNKKKGVKTTKPTKGKDTKAKKEPEINRDLQRRAERLMRRISHMKTKYVAEDFTIPDFEVGADWLLKRRQRIISNPRPADVEITSTSHSSTAVPAPGSDDPELAPYAFEAEDEEREMQSVSASATPSAATLTAQMEAERALPLAVKRELTAWLKQRELFSQRPVQPPPDPADAAGMTPQAGATAGSEALAAVTNETAPSEAVRQVSYFIPPMLHMRAANTVVLRLEEMPTVSEFLATVRTLYLRGWNVMLASSSASDVITSCVYTPACQGTPAIQNQTDGADTNDATAPCLKLPTYDRTRRTRSAMYKLLHSEDLNNTCEEVEHVADEEAEGEGEGENEGEDDGEGEGEGYDDLISEGSEGEGGNEFNETRHSPADRTSAAASHRSAFDSAAEAQSDVVSTFTPLVQCGEGEDVFICDAAVGTGCGRVLFGGMGRGEVAMKHNQLLRIEQEMQRVCDEINRRQSLLAQSGTKQAGEFIPATVVYGISKWRRE